MNKIGSKIKTSEFFSVCLQLCHQAANIIQRTKASGIYQQRLKSEFDPITIADIKCQTLIVNGLRKFWPNISFIGEQDI